MKRLRTPRSWLCAALLLALAGCGNGGADDDGAETGPPPPGTPYGTATDHILVKPATGVPLLTLLLDLNLNLIEEIDGTSYAKVAVPVGTTAVGLVSSLENDARIATATLDLGLAAPEGDGRTIPAGGLLLSAEIPNQAELQRIGLPAAQARATGAGVTVAVLDSGVVPHAFLDGRIAAGGRDFFAGDNDPTEERNGRDDDMNGHVDEGWGHGTSVASLVLAVAPDARIVPIRVLGSDLYGTSSAVASGISYAVNLGVHIVHLSIDLPEEMEVLREAIQSARARGVMVVASAGNTGAQDVNQPPGPDQAFFTTAVADDDVRADFASFGSGVALSAPGVALHAAFPSDNPDTAIRSGTSFSAPLVSGGLALLRELDPLAGVDVLFDRMRTNAASTSAANPGMDGLLGAGRLDLDATTAP